MANQMEINRQALENVVLQNQVEILQKQKKKEEKKHTEKLKKLKNENDALENALQKATQRIVRLENQKAKEKLELNKLMDILQNECEELENQMCDMLDIVQYFNQNIHF